MGDSTSMESDASTARNKFVGICVVFLDDSLHQIQIGRRALGNTLYTQVINRFRVVEPEYFDLEFYTASGKQCWLERSKEVITEWKKAVNDRDRDKDGEKERHEKSSARKSGAGELSSTDPVFYFAVKYFVPDPTQLRAENTRYLYALQIRRDLRTGQLFCSENTAALLISYIVQGDYGDFSEDFYVRARPFIRSHYKHVSLSTSASSLLNNSEFDALEQKIATYHRMHFGMTQNDADLCILDTARKIEFYSIKLYPVKDSDNIQLAICVVHFGVLIFQNRIKINSFNWSKIKKISYKKKKFVLKFRRAEATDEEPRGQDGVLETIEFAFASKEECRRFWQLAIDYHSFFRSYDTTGRPPAYAFATESLRKRAALLQTNTEGESAVLQPGGSGSQMALTQSMYVTPNTPTPSAYGFRPFGSLHRAALRRSNRQSMTPTPSMRMQSTAATQQPNGPNVGSSVPLSRHQLAPGCTTLPSRANFLAQQQQQQQLQTAAQLGRSPNGYASDTLESVRTACTSNSSGSHSLHAHDSRFTLAHDAHAHAHAHAQRQLSLESAPAGPLRGSNSLNASAQLLLGSEAQPSLCVCCSNPEYRPLESSGYGSSILQRPGSANGSCPNCGSRSLSLSQQAVAVRTPQLQLATDMQHKQTALSNMQLVAADPASLEQFMRMSQNQMVTSRSGTPHSHQLRHAHSVQHRATPTHNQPAQSPTQAQMQMQMQMQMQPAPGTYYPSGSSVQPANGNGNYIAAYPVGLIPTGPFAAGLTPAALRNSITNPSQSAINAANQLDALAIAATQPAAPGARVPDLSAYSSTVPVNTNTLNGRRGSSASTTGVNANVTGMNNATAGQPQTDSRMSAGRQASPALGVSAIEAQQETRLKSFQSFRNQKMPPNASNPRLYPAASPSLQPAAHHLTVNANSDARNSAALSMTASTVSNGSDSTMPESTATGSSAETDSTKPTTGLFARSDTDADADVDADADTGTPTAAETAQSSSSAANTLTRSDHSPAKHVLAPAALRTNGSNSNGAAPASAGRNTDSAAPISPAKDDEAALMQDDSLYTPLAAVSSGFPTSPSGVVHSPSTNAVSPPPLGNTATQNAALSGNQSYSSLLIQDALCQERTYVKDLRIIAVQFADYAREHASQFADVELELAASSRCQPQTPGMLEILLGFFSALYERHASLLTELEALSTTQTQTQTQPQPPKGTNAFLDVYVAGARLDVQLYHSYFSCVDQLACDYFVRLVQVNAFDTLVSKFEQDTKTCYLFVNDLFIKPIIHIHEYSLFLKKIENYVQLECTEQFAVSDKVLTQLGQLSATLQILLNECNPRIERLLRYLGLLEIRKDVLLNYAPPLDRAPFMRFGFVYKLSKKGYQQRMLFLFADFLLFANRTTNGSAVQFRARHCYSLTDVQIASAGTPRIIQPDVQPSIGAHSFQLLIHVFPPDSQQTTRLLTLVANSELERSGWLADLAKTISSAVQRAQNRPQERPRSPSKTRPVSPPSVPNEDAALLSLITQVAGTNLSNSQSHLPTSANRDEMRSPTPNASNSISTNSLVCVCWHRNNSLSAAQFSSLLESQISGYLLRKFQNSNGWQRLWSVFTKCCLFFYKTYQDDAPIASLPLWGYTVAIADETDQIQKAFVFKLTYKTHKYYFRTENDLAFSRWMQTLRAALLNNMQV